MGGHPAGGAGRAEALGLAPTIPRDRASAAACIPTTVHVPEPVSPNGRGSGRGGPAGLHPDLRGTVAPGVVGVGASHDASPGGPGELRHRRRAPNTSGRTGSFRGAELANMARNAQARIGFLGLTESDIIIGALPLFDSFGQTVAMNAGVLVGATLTLLPRFDPGRGARGHPARRRHRAGRRPDDVRRSAAVGGPRAGEHPVPAAGRLRRRVDSRGLRAVRDQPGRIVQPPGPGT